MLTPAVNVHLNSVGTFLDEDCVCDQNPTDGFWQRTFVEDEFTRVAGNGVETTEIHRVPTCFVCMDGVSGVDCTEFESVAVAVNKVASSPPTPVECKGCFSFGKKIMVDVDFIFVNITALPLITDCCTIGNVTSVLGKVILTGGTCVESETGMLHVGSTWCHFLSCEAYTWTERESNAMEMSFTLSSRYHLVLAAKSGSGKACAPTASPTLEATLTPTNYPT